MVYRVARRVVWLKERQVEQMNIKKLLRLVNTNFKPTGAVLVITYAPQKRAPTAEEARAAGQVIKQFCDRRTTNNACACKHCPLRDMCEAPPYAWKSE